MSVGIVGWGCKLPRNRIKLETIAEVWGADAPSYKKGLLLFEKSVPGPDEDVITLSVTALRNDNGVAEGFLFLAHKWNKCSRNDSTVNRSGNKTFTTPLPEQPMAESFRV